MSPTALVEFTGVVKQHQALRPLRLANLSIAPGATSVQGLDALAAEVLVNLMTAAMRPDEGDVRLFGRSTKPISPTTTPGSRCSTGSAC